jgi:hypothetical protein
MIKYDVKNKSNQISMVGIEKKKITIKRMRIKFNKKNQIKLI